MSEKLYIFYSKYSKACAAILPQVKMLAQYLTIIPIEIDDPETRKYLVDTGVKSVPCILLESSESLDLYEGDQVIKLLEKAFSMIQTQIQKDQTQQQIPTQQQYPQQYPSNQIQSIVDPNYAQQPPIQGLDVGASVNSRLAPQQVYGPPPGQPMLTNQLVQGQSVNQLAHLQQTQHQTPIPIQQQPAHMGIVPQDPQMQQAMAQAQMQQNSPPSVQGLQMIEPPSIGDNNNGIFSNTDGYSTADIVGAQTQTDRRDTSKAKSGADVLMREREASDKMMFPSMNQR